MLLQGRAVTLTFKVATEMLRAALSHYGDHFCEMILKSNFK
jgi:hypothetical protein